MLHTSSHWVYGAVSTTDTVTHCDPGRSRISNNTLTLVTSYTCWSMQVWCHLAGLLGYRPDAGSMYWVSVPKIAADDCHDSRQRCLFFLDFCSAGNSAVLDILYTVWVVGLIVPFVVVVLSLWGE